MLSHYKYISQVFPFSADDLKEAELVLNHDPEEDSSLIVDEYGREWILLQLKKGCMVYPAP